MQTTTDHDLSTLPWQAQNTLVSDAYAVAFDKVDVLLDDDLRWTLLEALLDALDAPTPTEQLAKISAVVEKGR